MMSQFRTTLRNRIDDVRQAITEARQAGDGYAASLHHARLEDLLHLAARNDVDTSRTVETTVTEPADPR
ncbi:hypothetical protein [Actinophytocola sp.]|uniref:hypothetical protein n=1 Tax=Actinophytocola sp. TaxID=1872138 RepID=UPI003D6C648B